MRVREEAIFLFFSLDLCKLCVHVCLNARVFFHRYIGLFGAKNQDQGLCILKGSVGVHESSMHSSESGSMYVCE